MISDVLGVRRTDPNIDEGHTLTIGRDEVVGRHLEALPLARRDGLFRLVRRVVAAPDLTAARQYDALVDVVCGEPAQAPAHELVDVAVIVGQQYPVLHVAPVAAGVVHEAMQGKIDAHGVEQRQRPRSALRHRPLAVRDLVADEPQERRREITGQLDRGHAPLGDLLDALQHEGIGNLLVAQPDLDLGAVLLHQRYELLEQIAAEVPRMRHRRFVDAGLLEFGERAAGAGGGADLVADHAQQRIAEGGALLERRGRAGCEIKVERAGERRAGLGINRLETIDRRLGHELPLVILRRHPRLPGWKCPHDHSTG
jgi:hypothetical protein